MLRYDTEVITDEYGDIAIGDLVGKKVHVYALSSWEERYFDQSFNKPYVTVSLTPLIPNGNDWTVPDIEDVVVHCTEDQQWVGQEGERVSFIQSGDIVCANAPDQNFDMWWIVNFVNKTDETDTMVGGESGPLSLANGVCVYM